MVRAEAIAARDGSIEQYEVTGTTQEEARGKALDQAAELLRFKSEVAHIANDDERWEEIEAELDGFKLTVLED